MNSGWKWEEDGSSCCEGGGKGAGGGSRELLDCSVDPIPVKGGEEGRGLGRRALVCCAALRNLGPPVPQQRFPINRVLCWSEMVWLQFPAVLSHWLGGTSRQ